MGSWLTFGITVGTIIILALRWYGGKERKKQEELDKNIEGIKKGDAQSVLDAFDNID